MTSSATPPSAGPALIGDILRHIPHRYPFILIDRMEECVTGKSVRCIKNVSWNEWFYNGTTPEGPVMPSMLLVEALAQSSGALTHYSGLMTGIRKPIIFFAGIDKCTFGRDVRAGDTVTLECTLLRALRDVIKVRGVASVDGQMALELILMAVVRDMEEDGN
jgi:3-hydroxyacyl-[acyl-carrier-protein] dehydratase